MTETAPRTKATILVVDDMPDNLTLIAGLLRGLYRVVAANNGEKAIAIASGEHPPDLILLDIMMPGLSGYDVCQRLKAQPATRDIPIIFLTAMTGTEKNGVSVARPEPANPASAGCGVR